MAMKLRKSAHRIIDCLPDDKIAYVIAILRGIEGLNIAEEDPDEIDLALIRDALQDNEESSALDDFVKELGFSVDEFQN